jgi:hypothetical protein
MATNALFADGLADDRKRLLADLAIRRDIVRIADVEFIDLRFGHKFIDVDRALALDCNGFELLGCELDVLALGDLVAFDDVALLDVVACLGIHLAVADALPVSLLSWLKLIFSRSEVAG